MTTIDRSPTLTEAPIRLGDAAWIGPVEAVVPPAGKRPAYELRTQFESSEAGRARLSVTAHGIYEAFLNGRRIGDAELTPGFTSYHQRLYVQDYDVTELLAPGTNELRLVVSDGWWRGRFGGWRVPDNFGTHVAVVARLFGDTSAGDGEVLLAETGPHWEFRVGPIVAADLMDGQTTDLRRLDADEWAPVAVVPDAAIEGRVLERSPAPAVRRTAEYAPVAITRLACGRQVVDFGTNLNGWVRLNRLGPAGRRTVLTHGELLTADGDVDQENIRMAVYPDDHLLPAGQVDTVISRGVAGDVFEPRHTTHGFRYVAVDGCAEDLTASDITAIMVRSDLRAIGTFHSDHPDLNRLHQITRQSWHANTCDIPTDCPTRERFGYTGDFQVFAETAALLDDISGFARKWLRSVRDDQHPDGKAPNVAPSAGVQPGFPKGAMDGSGGWGDAATIVPWAVYQAYGDLEVLRENLPLMRGWVDWAAGIAASQRHHTRVAARPEPAPHERYLWDAGFHWGEWTEPDQPGFDYMADKGIIATAYLARSSQLLASAARELGDAETHDRYAALHENVRAAWQAEFVTPDGRLTTDRQAHYVRALAWDLVSEDLRPAMITRLVELIEDAGDHLTTGFLATPMLLPVLADNGRLDVAYRVLTQRTEPSWFAMLDNGATTIWENWDGSSSQNHYPKGAVSSFLYTHVAGLRRDAPGYRDFTVRVRPTSCVLAAEATIASPYGLIRSAWRITDGVLTTQVTVPHGTTATIDLPGREPFQAGPGEHTYTEEGVDL